MSETREPNGYTAEGAGTIEAPPPEVLSSIALPIFPPNVSAEAGPSWSGTSARSDKHGGQRYAHALLSHSINPCMDLVALISRDTDAPNSSTSTTADPHAGLPPPPAGMSAARSAALMRMRMAQRAKALAAAGIKEEAPSAAAGPSAMTGLVRCATLRLSLWRMASIAGEQGARVWDVAVTVPTRMGDPPSGSAQLEEISVGALAWRADGFLLALAVSVRRRASSDLQVLHCEQYICLYALQDGRQVAVVPFEESDDIVGLEWNDVADDEGTYAYHIGSAHDVLTQLPPLREVASIRDDQDKARQRQRMFQAMRQQRRTNTEKDKSTKELIESDPRGLGKVLNDFPRTHGPDAVTSAPAAAPSDTSPPSKMSVLVASSKANVHLFLDGTVYLGRKNTDLDRSLLLSHYDRADGSIHVVGGRLAFDKVTLDRLGSHLTLADPRFRSLLLLQNLSSHAFGCLTYAFDAVVSMRSTYHTLHGDCIQAWNRRAILTAKRYATDFSSELCMLLATGVANDTMLSVLLGNDTLSENDLKKMRGDVLSALHILETAAEQLCGAVQHAIVVFEELKGCLRWPERFGWFFGQDAVDLAERSQQIDTVLAHLVHLVRQSMHLQRLCGQEYRAWIHFYRFWMYERARQEAVRDNKAIPEALVAAGVGNVPFDTILLVEFFRRGFYSTQIEAVLEISMDVTTRRGDVEDDDEEDGEEVGKDVVPSTTENGAIHKPIDTDADMDKADAIQSPDGVLTRMDQTIAALQAPPQPEQLFRCMGKLTPSAQDYGRLAREPQLVSQSIHGLAQRRTTAPITPPLKATVEDCLRIASPLFRRSFERWCRAHMSDDKTDAVQPSRMPLSLGTMTLASGRGEGLGSSARPSMQSKSSTMQEDVALVRGHLSRVRQEQRLALVVDDLLDGSTKLVLMALPLQGNSAVLQAIIALEEDNAVVDMGFYSSDEVVLLLERPVWETEESTTASTQSVMVTVRWAAFRFEPVDSAPPVQSWQCERIVVVDEFGGGRAKRLALNRKKEVCATLDDDGHLLYWDLVQQGSPTEEAAGAEASKAETADVEDRDDEMT